jgi:hypothetical protein
MWKSIGMATSVMPRVTAIGVRQTTFTTSRSGGRLFSTSTRRFNVEDMNDYVNPSNFQKKILVWGRIYKTIEEVPDRVSATKMKKGNDLFRIRVSIGMVIMTFIGCGVMIIYGRRLRDSGDSLTSRTNKQIAEWKAKG